MALRLRRGTNADRLTVTPAEGELLYTTDSKKIYAGDGSTVGGNIVSGINNLLEDLTPQLGGDLDLNSKSLVGNGNIDITGSITAPSFTGDFYGSVFGDDSELLVDVINSKILLSNNVLADLSDVQVTGLQPGNVLKWNGNNWYAATDSQVDLSAESLNSLGDVNVSGVQLGQVLKWNGNNWYAATDSQVDLSAESLNSLGDVNVDGVQVGQVLTWGGSEWTSSELNLSQLADVNTNNAVQGYSLIFDGVNWQAGQVPGPELYNLANVSAANPNNNDVLSYNSFTNNWENKSLALDDMYDINLTGLQLGDVLTWNGFSWVPDGGIGTIRETDIQGSVYSLDSSILVDAVTSTINVQRLNATDNTFTLQSNNAVDANFNFTHNIDQSGGRTRLYMTRSSSADLSTNFDIAGSLEVIDSGSNGNITHNKILFTKERGVWFVTPDGDQSTNDACITIYSPNGVDATRKGRLGVGTVDPAEKLDVRGNITTTGFVQFGRYTTLERDDLTTTNTPQYATNYGMVIYNTDINKFQGWQNTGGTTPEWVDLS